MKCRTKEKVDYHLNLKAVENDDKSLSGMARICVRKRQYDMDGIIMRFSVTDDKSRVQFDDELLFSGTEGDLRSTFIGCHFKEDVELDAYKDGIFNVDTHSQSADTRYVIPLANFELSKNVRELIEQGTEYTKRSSGLWTPKLESYVADPNDQRGVKRAFAVFPRSITEAAMRKGIYFSYTYSQRLSESKTIFLPSCRRFLSTPMGGQNREGVIQKRRRSNY